MAVVNSSMFNFKEVVDGLMKTYMNDVLEVGFEVIPKVADEAARKLRQESKAKFPPSGKHKRKYYSGWRSRREEVGRMRVVATVYGESGTYQLAHLLENGHVSRNGTGRTFKPVDGREHITSVEQWAIDKAYNNMLDKLEHLP